MPDFLLVYTSFLVTNPIINQFDTNAIRFLYINDSTTALQAKKNDDATKYSVDVLEQL